MVQSVLGSLILGYRPLWNRARKLAAIQLYVHSEASALVDTAHLLRTLQELWSASSPPILLSPQSHQLLSNDGNSQCDVGQEWRHLAKGQLVARTYPGVDYGVSVGKGAVDHVMIHASRGDQAAVSQADDHGLTVTVDQLLEGRVSHHWS